MKDIPPWNGIDAARLAATAASASDDLVGRLRAERAALIAALDLVDEAIVLLDRSGLVVRANRAASDLLQAARAIRLGPDGRLLIDDGDARETFTRALRRLAPAPVGSPPAPAPASEQIPVPRAAALPLMLTLHALGEGSAGGNVTQAVALARICDPEVPRFDREAVLQMAYGLTPAEVKLVLALNEGLTLKEFALRSGLTYETVRSYVKRVLARVGARSQADLMRLTGGLR